MSNIVMVRGAGDLATGTIHKLFKCGYRVLATEQSRPSSIRRRVALSEAVYEGSATVEGVTARLAADLNEALKILENGQVPVLTDPDCRLVRELRPAAVVDAILAKRNLGTSMDMAPVTIALGPGFAAGEDVCAVIETMRGHNLGRIIWKGKAAPNTGKPGVVEGHEKERVIYAQVGGRIKIRRDIGSVVEKGEIIAYIDSEPVYAALTGLIRGMIREGYPTVPGLKIADIDPRKEQIENCSTISDKARCIAGGVLEALMTMGVLP
ncbi:MAG TPA: EF2563 family selenium-dependent molybdenum hydroxylase system protein [Clostridiales bacterium]|nr:EF2563 family selenium-dependent molybdenum hydroxylase system protein [Clostridiales bacterium]